MKLRFAVLCALAFAVACRSGRPPAGAQEAPLSALTATTNEDAMRELLARRAAFAGARSYMRVRATSNGKSQSFRAQLQVDAKGRMLLTAYTPVNTSAMRLYADGDRVTLYNDLERTKQEGSSAELAKSVGFFAPSLTPAELALLIIGYPPSPSAGKFVTTPAGLASASVGDLSITYDPPQFPPVHVVVERPGQKLEIEHLELVASDAKVAP
jgi:hypothetical protein